MHRLMALCGACARAGLCVALVYAPASLARWALPWLYPLKVALFDPLTQVCRVWCHVRVHVRAMCVSCACQLSTARAFELRHC
jgi:hypothetical protein